MIRAEVGQLAWVLGMLRKLTVLASNSGLNLEDSNHKSTVLNQYKVAREEFEKYGLTTAIARLALANQYVTTIPAYPNAELKRDVEETLFSAEEELKKVYFGYVRSEKAGELLQVDRIWRKVWTAFPSCEGDARAAAACYAFGLNDACVYHSMMVLERGFSALAKKLGVNAGAKSWGTVIDDLESEILKKRQSLRARKPSDFLTFLSVAAKEFTYFKDAWRNHVAHGRARYDENDARKVLTHARDFMEHLSVRLKDGAVSKTTNS